MTSIGTLRELDAAVEEVLSAEVGCAAQLNGCPRTATWYAVPGAHDCDGAAVPFCDPCRTAFGAWRFRYRCRHCGADPVPLRWEPIR